MRNEEIAENAHELVKELLRFVGEFEPTSFDRGRGTMQCKFARMR